MEYTLLENAMFAKYFALRSLVGEGYPHMRELFDKLASVYFIAKDRGDVLFRLSEQEEISSIICYDDYLVAKRALDYNERFGTPVILSEDIMFALNCKGQGLREMHAFVLDCGKQSTATKIKACMMSQKYSKNIHVSFVVAFLLYEGIILHRDEEKAKKCAEKCLHWNNFDGALLLLHHAGATERNEYVSALYTMAHHMNLQEEFRRIFIHYGWEKTTLSQSVLLVAQYLDRHIDEVETFDSTVAKLANSSVISLGDRKRLLESADRSAMHKVADLALTDKIGNTEKIVRLREFVSKERGSEANQIEVCLRKQQKEQIKVPIIVCRDNIALCLYADAFGRLNDSDTIYIDGSECTGGCFAPTKGNLIVKNLISHNTGKATFVFERVTEMGKNDIEQLSMLLSPINRGAYLLQDIDVMLDLSGCTFVLLADSEIPETLARVCQRITINPATKDETKNYVESVINENKVLYECPELSFQQDAISYLTGYNDIARINTIVGTICRQHSYETSKSIVDKEEAVKATAPMAGQMSFRIGG